MMNVLTTNYKRPKENKPRQTSRAIQTTRRRPPRSRAKQQPGRRSRPSKKKEEVTGSPINRRWRTW